MNTDRTTAPQTSFGLVAWLEQTRVTLPLKGVECQFQVTGAIACVELDQVYHQNASKPLDCTYTFPMPAGAAVYRCELHVNGRVIRAKVEEKEKARQIFQEQKAAGRRAALVETERENLFTLSLGNVQPGDVIVVRLAWFQVLDRAGDGLRLLVPTCPGVRYIPGKPLLRALSGRGTVDDTDQVPDASRISPPRIDALHPDAAYFSIEGSLSSSDVESGTASSPSHPLFVQERDGTVKVELSSRATVPDRDFVLVWEEPKVAQLAPQAWRWTEGDESYALVQLRAPEHVNVAGSFAQDFYFLVDRSGSMQGAKWQQTCVALRAFVGLLGAEDRVWITLFETGYRDFAEAPMAAPTVLADTGFRRLEALGTGGGTELLPAATHVFEKITAHSAGRRTSVVLITDGQVGNESEVGLAFKKVQNVTVHAFGIDTAVNDAFLKSLARQHRGGCWLQTPDDDIAGTIVALGDRLRRPVLTDLAVAGSWEAGSGAWPDLHAREVVTIALRGKVASTVEITGRFPDGTMHHFSVGIGTPGSEAIKLLWAKERMTKLIESGRQQEAVAVAKAHNLICEGTAFIAWDEAEQVEIAEEHVVQPVIVTHMEAAMAPLRMEHRVHRCMDSDGSHDYREHVAKCAVPSSIPRRAPERPRKGIISKLLRTIIGTPKSDVEKILTIRIAMLSEALEREQIAESTSDAIATWAGGADTSKRVEDLESAMETIAKMRRELDSPGIRDGLKRITRQALDGSPASFVKWASLVSGALRDIVNLRQRLTRLGMPEEVIAHLLTWVLEPGETPHKRTKQISSFVDSLERQSLSKSAAALRWQTFLDEIFAPKSKAWSVAAQWLLT